MKCFELWASEEVHVARINYSPLCVGTWSQPRHGLLIRALCIAVCRSVRK